MQNEPKTAQIDTTDDAFDASARALRIDVPRTGFGSVKIARTAGKSVVVRAAANSPLKILTPRTPSDSAWIFTSTYGGGLVGGDQIALRLDAAPYTSALLSTQASTKVFRTGGPICSQHLDVHLDEGAMLISAPDPIVCFAGGKYEQCQRFDLAAGAGLIMIDWFTSGRRARGERWEFLKYQSHSEVFLEERCIFRDTLLLDPANGSLAGDMRMGLIDCFATIVIVGRPVEAFAMRLLQYINEQPATRSSPLLFSASPIAKGIVIRVAGNETESVGRWMRDRLAHVVDLIGHDPWARKW